MHLNADIVFDNLPEKLHARLSGQKELDLKLARPQLYEGGEVPFEAHHLYLVNAERVPQHADAGRGSVIVCIGDTPALERYRRRCCVINVAVGSDFFQTFNALQKVFDAHDNWADELQHIVESDADIQRILECSEPIFDNPLYAIDEDFRILGLSPMALTIDTLASRDSGAKGSLKLESIDTYLEHNELSMNEREPLVLNVLDQTTLNYNLIDADTYRGCVTVHYTQRPYRESDKPLIEFLGHVILGAIRQHATHSPEGRGSLRQAVQGLVDERPLDAVERNILDGANNGGRYVCLRLKLSSRLEQLPLGYVRNAVEAAFPKSIVFEHHRNSVVVVLPIGSQDEGSYREAIATGIGPFIGSMEMTAGVSNPYDDLMAVRALYQQADAALDAGMLFSPSDGLYFFGDYALREMVMDMAGAHRLDTLLDEGLRRLVEHDRTSTTSYIETLRSFLDNDASVAKTASELYVHRSTLMERLARIKRDLNVDLDDPDERLRLRILLKTMQVRNELRERGL